MRQFTAKALLIAFFVMLSTGRSAAAQALEEITVTAQKREQSLQTVPVAVTAISPEQMELKQISNVHDLQYQTPNISIARNTGTPSGARIFLRGIGEDDSRITADPAVAIYVDGIYIGRQIGALFDIVDLERIEVLRGPQGTLYGRNANGGAIKLVSKRPQFDQNTLDIKATFGSDSRRDMRATGNLVLADSTAARLTLMTKNRDGFHTVNPNGALADRAGTEVGDQGVNAMRLGLGHDFSNAWNAYLTLDYTKDKSDPTPDSFPTNNSFTYNDRDNDLFTIEPLEITNCTDGSTFLGCFTGYNSEVETKGVSLNISGEVGDYTLRLLTGYRTLDDDLLTSSGIFPSLVVPQLSLVFRQQTDQEQFSQEITLGSDYSGPFNFVTGFYYFHEDANRISNPGSKSASGQTNLNIETDAWAVFLQGDYTLPIALPNPDSLTLTAGIRYTDETKDLTAARLDRANGTRVESRDFQNVTFTVSLNNQFTDDIMGYFSYARGFKSGGWSSDCGRNADVNDCFLPVDEEIVNSFEWGLRSDLFSDRLRLNLTYYYNLYDDLQLNGTLQGGIFTRFNVEEVSIHGLEAEMIFRATDNLTLNATFGTINAEYEEVALNQTGVLGCSMGTDAERIACAKDKELKNAPDYKGTVGLVHTLAVGGGVLTSGVDVSFEDESFGLAANSDYSKLDIDPLVDARIAFAPNNGNWQVALWGKNLTDEEYARASLLSSQYAADPLTFGADFGINF